MQKLVDYINSKHWWHVTPVDPLAYQKRGKFFSHSFARAEFWGRPNDEPEKVSIRNPIVGDNNTVERKLLGRVESFDDMGTPKRFALDAKMYKAALKKGFDSIVVLSPIGFQQLRQEGKIPRSIELNVIQAQWNALKH